MTQATRTQRSIRRSLTLGRVAIVIAFIVIVAGILSSCGEARGEGKTLDSVERLKAIAKSVAARPEVPEDAVRVKHILVKKKDGRTLDETNEIAAKLLAKVEAGESFEELMKLSEDTGGGDYTLFDGGPGKPPPPGADPRSRMVSAFGDVGWRLKIGQVGVSLYDEKASPHGVHIIKRYSLKDASGN